MKNILRSSIAKKAVLFAFIAGIVSPSAFAGWTASTYSPAGSNGSQTLTAAPYVSASSDSSQTLTAVDYTPVSTTPVLANNYVSVTPTVSAPIVNADTLTAVEYTPVSTNPVIPNNYVAAVPTVNALTTSSTLVAELAPVISGVSITPNSYNPANGSASISFSLNTTARTTIWILDANDKVVSTVINDALLNSGSSNYSWNGRDNNGNTVANGNYKVRVHAFNSVDNATEYTNFSIVGSNVSAPSLSLTVGNGSFNPDQGQTTTITYTLSGAPADVRILVKDSNGNTIRTLKPLATTQPGTYQLPWDGRNDSGSIVPAGNYTVEVYATNANGSDTETGSTAVVRDGSNNTCDIISNHFIQKPTFDPENESNYISYRLARSADVTVRIKDGSSTVITLQSGNLNSGNQTVYWNGRNSSGSFVSDKSYTYEIRANVSGCSEDRETGSVRVDRDGNDNDDDDYESDWPSTDEDLIKNIRVINDIFDPTEGERSTIEFELTDDADLKVEVLDGTKVVKTLRNADDQSEGDYSYNWDGRDSDGDIVRDRLYQYRVMADNGDDTDTDRAYVEVDTDGIIIGFPTEARCAGFKDVSIYSPFCKAIELMSKKNIFEGYSDGTFRPNVAIKRAEATKVIVLALDFDVPTGRFFGKQFNDTASNAWYTPYLEVALDNGIIDGYPDGSFRPANTINRVELLKIFLNAHKLDLPTCSVAPFNDTPINADTAWYMPFACYAKQNGLMNARTSGNLFPAKPMTRGDVADLFYDFEMKGYYADYERDSRYTYCEYDRYGDLIDEDCLEGNNRYTYNNEDAFYRYTDNRNYNYNDNYTYDSNDGYYVYRNGRYEWVRY